MPDRVAAALDGLTPANPWRGANIWPLVTPIDGMRMISSEPGSYAMSRYSRELGREYRRLFETLEVRSVRVAEVERLADRTLGLRVRYCSIGDPIQVPWYFIAAVHLRCCGGRDQRLTVVDGRPCHLGRDADAMAVRQPRRARHRPLVGKPWQRLVGWQTEFQLSPLSA